MQVHQIKYKRKKSNFYKSNENESQIWLLVLIF